MFDYLMGIFVFCFIDLGYSYFLILHMEDVRLEVEEKKKRQARQIMEAIEVGVAERLRTKE